MDQVHLLPSSSCLLPVSISLKCFALPSFSIAQSQALALYFTCFLVSLPPLPLFAKPPFPPQDRVPELGRGEQQAGLLQVLSSGGIHSLLAWGKTGQKPSRPKMLTSRPPEEDKCGLSLAQLPAFSLSRSRVAGLTAGCSPQENREQGWGSSVQSPTRSYSSANALKSA